MASGTDVPKIRCMSSGADTPQTNGSVRVVVVDDDSLVRGLITRALGRAGFVTFEAADGQEGLDIVLDLSALEEPPAVMVVDRHMPVMDGDALVREIRAIEEFEFLPIIMMSAEPGAEGLFDAFVAKPFANSELISLIERLLKP